MQFVTSSDCIILWTQSPGAGSKDAGENTADRGFQLAICSSWPERIPPPRHSLPWVTQVLSGKDCAALFRLFSPSAIKQTVLLQTPRRLLWIILTVSNGVFVHGSISSSLLASLAPTSARPQATEVGLVRSRPSGWQGGNPSQPKQTAEQAGSKREEIVFS